MNKISDLISMPVISMYEGNHIGIIYNMLFDCKLKKCKYITILDEKENIPKTIHINNIYKIGKECVFIKNEECIELSCCNDNELFTYINPINMKVYNLNGESLGTCIDIKLNQNHSIEEIIINNSKTINSNEIFNIGKKIILINNNSLTLSKFKPKTKINKIENNNDNKVVILNNNDIKEKKYEQNNKIITDSRFLIGRILNKDIISFNGEIIAKNGSVINKEMINKASTHGKLIEIARYSNKK